MLVKVTIIPLNSGSSPAELHKTFPGNSGNSGISRKVCCAPPFELRFLCVAGLAPPDDTTLWL